MSVCEDTPRRQSINHQSSTKAFFWWKVPRLCSQLLWDGLKQSLTEYKKSTFATTFSPAWSQEWSCPLLRASIALSGSAAQEAHREFQVTAKFQAWAGHAAKFYQPSLMGMLPPSKWLNPSFMLQICNTALLEDYSVSNPAAFFFAFFRRMKWVKGTFWAWWTAVPGSGNTTSITVTRREQSTMRINSRSSNHLILHF